MHHVLKASPAACHWGYFDSRLPAAMTISSGDTIVIDSLSGQPGVVPTNGEFRIPEELFEIHKHCQKPLGPGHICTGPVAVEGAEPGDVLEVRILDISLRTDWGFTFFRPLVGSLPQDFPHYRLVHVRLDEKRMMAELPWGGELPLSPFFGVIGVAPPENWGAISTIPPRAHGGNIDNKELVSGTTIFLPVWVKGGQLSIGDGHAAQGDGEVCVTAIETMLTGTFQITLHKGMGFKLPRAETPTHYITMGFDADLDVAAQIALREMIQLICERTSLSKDDAYMLCSMAADMRITQMVNQQKGVHAMLSKDVLAKQVGARL